MLFHRWITLRCLFLFQVVAHTQKNSRQKQQSTNLETQIFGRFKSRTRTQNTEGCTPSSTMKINVGKRTDSKATNTYFS